MHTYTHAKKCTEIHVVCRIVIQYKLPFMWSELLLRRERILSQANMVQARDEIYRTTLTHLHAPTQQPRTHLALTYQKRITNKKHTKTHPPKIHTCTHAHTPKKCTYPWEHTRKKRKLTKRATSKYITQNKQNRQAVTTHIQITDALIAHSPHTHTNCTRTEREKTNAKRTDTQHAYAQTHRQTDIKQRAQAKKRKPNQNKANPQQTKTR